jgi:hypothetical protein
MKGEDGTWPPGKRVIPHGDGTTATPYLVIPFSNTDAGARPGVGVDPRRPAGIGVEVVDATGSAVATPTSGQSYRLRATIRNFGTTASYAGLADFYISPRSVFKVARTGRQSPSPQGRAGFSVQPNQSIVVESPTAWTPSAAGGAFGTDDSVLVHAWDLLLDPLGAPFDWIGNRHVAMW